MQEFIENYREQNLLVLMKQEGKPLAYKIEITSRGKVILGFTEELSIAESYKDFLMTSFNRTRNLESKFDSAGNSTDQYDMIRIIPVRTGQENQLNLQWSLVDITNQTLEIQLEFENVLEVS